MLHHMDEMRAQAATPEHEVVRHAGFRSIFVAQRRQGIHERVRVERCRRSDEDVQDGLCDKPGHARTAVVLEAQG